jgi:hypothetical protein
MEKLLEMIKFYYKAIKKSHLLIALSSLIAIGLIIYFFFQSQIQVVLSAFIGILLMITIRNAYKTFRSQREDKIKSNENLKTLKKKYPLSKFDQLSLNPKLDLFFVDLGKVEGKEIIFKVSPEPFDIDLFIKHHFFNIMSSHHMSSYQNSPTIRLKDVDCSNPNQIIYTIQKSDYYNHLVTNRAIDYPIQNKISLRDVYEPGPKLSNPNASKMSNHIGLNMIIILSDDYVIMPQRRWDATYSKNRVTSSVAARFEVSECKSCTIFDIKEQLIQKSIQKLKIREDIIKDKHHDLHFIGAAQSIYEGGKPQFYFAIRIENYTSKDYLKSIGTLKLHNYKEGIDEDKRLFLLDLKSFKILDNYKLQATAYNKRYKRKTLPVEKSFFANLYYLENSCHFKQIFSKL